MTGKAGTGGEGGATGEAACNDGTGTGTEGGAAPLRGAPASVPEDFPSGWEALCAASQGGSGVAAAREVPCTTNGA